MSTTKFQKSALLCLLSLLLGNHKHIRYATAFKASLHRQQLMNQYRNENWKRQRYHRPHLDENSRLDTTLILFYPDPKASMDLGHYPNHHLSDNDSGYSATSALSASIMNDFDEADGNKSSLDVSSSPSPLAQYLTLGIPLLSVSIFLLVNRFVGPWPLAFLEALPEPYWLLIHYISGTMFAGTIAVSAILENMVVKASEQEQNNDQLVSFWFHQVPQMDAKLVLPSILSLLISGTASSHYRYGSLALAPKHIMLMFVHLVAFLVWWAVTDVTTQTKVLEWYNHDETEQDDNSSTSLQQILGWRKISNVGSCLFLLALFAIMTLKPGMAML